MLYRWVDCIIFLSSSSSSASSLQLLLLCCAFFFLSSRWNFYSCDSLRVMCVRDYGAAYIIIHICSLLFCIMLYIVVDAINTHACLLFIVPVFDTFFESNTATNEIQFGHVLFFCWCALFWARLGVFFFSLLFKLIARAAHRVIACHNQRTSFRYLHVIT